MNLDLQHTMAEATRLTRSGQLTEAVALLRGLGTAAAPVAPAPATRAADAVVIDVAARVLPATAPGAGAAPAPTTAAAAAGAASPVAAGFSTHHFSNAADARDYKLFVPRRADATAPLPLVVMLHGCTQNPDDFAAGTRMNVLAEQHGFAVLYPAQSHKANPQGCWNWFKHTHQARGRGEPALIAGMVREVMARLPIDPRRVYVAGLSAGGAMAAILGETYPELFAAVGVHSGLAAGAARDLPSALAAMKGGLGQPAQGGGGTAGSGRPTIVFHGDADQTVDVRNARAVLAASAGPAARGETSQVPGRRGATREVVRDASGAVVAELWLVHGAPHAWSGGGAGSYTDPAGPDASAEMWRFFAEHPRP